MSKDEVSLKEYVDQRFTQIEETISRRFTDYDKAIQTAIASADKAIMKTDLETKEYKKQQNEWRGTLSDIVGNMLTRKEFNSIIITAVSIFGLLIAAVGLLFTVIGAVITITKII